ncbi:DUF6361 family protein [Janthinobacterium lividum]|uniref:DUF6361 family protein n=1 Tax=Janthinobacterium lividum TaxID=29581 RepID=UPI0008746E0B|nr:DUF6361 family protein [Janthinobacterium lividum]OEZ62305.1 hypothetical protein JANLI_10090 [Janthinobacterium lividum]WQE31862.1 DUF6361 family protein [Janthinobacterium lividum]STS86125.1 Uncharacterised protein [Janthinobacterium lividum]
MKKNQTVDPSFGWSYLSRDALARAKSQMEEESVGVRDEIGFLTLHQRYADYFFPGTSVLHSRARYAVMVPWLFEDLSKLNGDAARKALIERERQLAGRLKGEGIIGKRVYPKPASQAPSTIYWNALSVWGILKHGANNRKISRRQAHKMLNSATGAKDDDGLPLLLAEHPFIRLPKRPATWFEGELTPRLTKKEAAFLRDRLSILPRLDGSNDLSLLALLVKTQSPAPASMWGEEVFTLDPNNSAVLRRAEQAAYLAGIGRAIYDGLVELLSSNDQSPLLSSRHTNHIPEIVSKYGSAAVQLDIGELEQDVGVLPKQLKTVLLETQKWIVAGKHAPEKLLSFYRIAEARKGIRARLSDSNEGRLRRREWALDEHATATPLHYRWTQVSTLLNDLADAQ